MHIAIIGARGPIALHFAYAARQRGHRLTALNPRRRASIRRWATVKPVRNRDLAGLTEAIADDVDAVVSLVCVQRAWRARGVVDLHAATTAGVMEAMDRAGVRRFLALSSRGVTRRPEAQSLRDKHFMGPVYRDLRRVEAMVAGSDLDYTIVRPPALTGGGPTGRWRVLEGGEIGGERPLRRGDLAAFLVAAVEDAGPWSRARIDLAAGAEARQPTFTPRQNATRPLISAAAGLGSG